MPRSLADGLGVGGCMRHGWEAILITRICVCFLSLFFSSLLLSLSLSPPPSVVLFAAPLSLISPPFTALTWSAPTTTTPASKQGTSLCKVPCTRWSCSDSTAACSSFTSSCLARCKTTLVAQVPVPVYVQPPYALPAPRPGATGGQPSPLPVVSPVPPTPVVNSDPGGPGDATEC